MSWSPRSVSGVAVRKVVSSGIRPRYSLVVEEDVKKPTKQTAMTQSFESMMEPSEDDCRLLIDTNNLYLMRVPSLTQN